MGREALVQQIPHLRSPVAEQLNFQVRPLAPQRRHIRHHAVAQAEDISLRHAPITDGMSANPVLYKNSICLRVRQLATKVWYTEESTAGCYDGVKR